MLSETCLLTSCHAIVTMLHVSLAVFRQCLYTFNQEKSQLAPAWVACMDSMAALTLPGT